MIYKSNDGDLWCECGNREWGRGFPPVDASGNRLKTDQITGDEQVYQCDVCKVITDLARTPVREDPVTAVLGSKLKHELEVRSADSSYMLFCGHEVPAGGLFVVNESGEPVPWTYCAECAPILVRGLLQPRPDDEVSGS